jgi:dihydrofolate synthase/folylpolyglutamate synthase
MLVTLDGVIDKGVLTMAPTAAERGWDAAWLKDWLHRPDRPPARAQWMLVPDFQKALRTVQEGGGTVLVTGSFHTVGDVMESLGIEPV